MEIKKIGKRIQNVQLNEHIRAIFILIIVLKFKISF